MGRAQFAAADLPLSARTSEQAATRRSTGVPTCTGARASKSSSRPSSKPIVRALRACHPNSRSDML
eukprot:8836880-Pyramimonas_sp.AAC.1